MRRNSWPKVSSAPNKAPRPARIPVLRYVCHIHVDQFSPDILDFSEHISCNCTICLSLATGVRRPQDQSDQTPQGTRNRKRPPGCPGHGTVEPLGEGLLAAHAVLVRRRAGFLAGVSPGFKRHDGHGDQHAAGCEHAGNERDEQDLEDGFHGRMASFLYIEFLACLFTPIGLGALFRQTDSQASADTGSAAPG